MKSNFRVKVPSSSPSRTRSASSKLRNTVEVLSSGPKINEYLTPTDDSCLVKSWFVRSHYLGRSLFYGAELYEGDWVNSSPVQMFAFNYIHLELISAALQRGT